MSIEDFIIDIMNNSEKQAKIQKMIYNLKRSAPLEKYKLYMKLKKMGVHIGYDY